MGPRDDRQCPQQGRLSHAGAPGRSRAPMVPELRDEATLRHGPGGTARRALSLWLTARDDDRPLCGAPGSAAARSPSAYPVGSSSLEGRRGRERPIPAGPSTGQTQRAVRRPPRRQPPPGVTPWREGTTAGHREDLATGCWLWVGPTFWDGYGRAHERGREGRQMRAHRLYYERHVGAIPKGTELDHLCGNRRCVNPAHLQPVPHIVNCQRGRKSKLTAEIVRAIRARYSAGGITQAELEREYGIASGTVCRIMQGTYWRNV